MENNSWYKGSKSRDTCYKKTFCCPHTKCNSYTLHPSPGWDILPPRGPQALPSFLRYYTEKSEVRVRLVLSRFKRTGRADLPLTYTWISHRGVDTVEEIEKEGSPVTDHRFQ